MPPAVALVNSSFDVANANLSEVQQAHRDSEELLDDVTEAEGITLIYVVKFCHALQTFVFERAQASILYLDRHATPLRVDPKNLD